MDFPPHMHDFIAHRLLCDASSVVATLADEGADAIDPDAPSAAREEAANAVLASLRDTPPTEGGWRVADWRRATPALLCRLEQLGRDHFRIGLVHGFGALIGASARTLAAMVHAADYVGLDPVLYIGKLHVAAAQRALPAIAVSAHYITMQRQRRKRIEELGMKLASERDVLGLSAWFRHVATTETPLYDVVGAVTRSNDLAAIKAVFFHRRSSDPCDDTWSSVFWHCDPLTAESLWRDSTVPRPNDVHTLTSERQPAFAGERGDALRREINDWLRETAAARDRE